MRKRKKENEREMDVLYWCPGSSKERLVVNAGL